MASRRKSRIVAMQILYQIQLTAEPVQDIMDQFWQSQDIDAELRPFAEQLVGGTITHLAEIDAKLQTSSQNWKLHRMPIVDLSILRCGTYEILYVNDIDPEVSINEAIEIAKTYSTPKSPKFINGILDNILKRHLNTTVQIPHDNANV